MRANSSIGLRKNLRRSGRKQLPRCVVPRPSIRPVSALVLLLRIPWRRWTLPRMLLVLKAASIDQIKTGSLLTIGFVLSVWGFLS